MRPRIHWCPTGAFAFVPVHAAGIYHGADQECCSDYFVSSYTPTLTALLRAQQGAVTYNTQDVRVAAIAAKRAHDKALPPLQYVDRESEQLVEAAGTAGASATFLGQSTSKEDVIASIKTAHIVHLACHGIQHDSKPHESHFCLGSGNLTVSDLMGMNLGDAFFAFLSACETAKGDRKHADEVVHLAATMMFAGFKSVVATMW
jgi:CHAT domain-containing protein